MRTQSSFECRVVTRSGKLAKHRRVKSGLRHHLEHLTSCFGSAACLFRRRPGAIRNSTTECSRPDVAVQSHCSTVKHIVSFSNTEILPICRGNVEEFSSCSDVQDDKGTCEQSHLPRLQHVVKMHLLGSHSPAASFLTSYLFPDLQTQAHQHVDQFTLLWCLRLILSVSCMQVKSP